MKLKKLSSGTASQRLVWLSLRSAELPSREARRAAGVGIDTVAYLVVVALIFVIFWVATP
jgi:hypothetical protein|tara:strand:+ start:232 stop:411 length:180 start_codon:yes stop_codon:yes gene_type:complete